MSFKALASPLQGITDETEQGLVDLLRRATKHLQQLQNIVYQVVSGNSPSGLRRYQRIPWLRNKSKAEAILKELQSIKLSLTAILTARNSVQLCRIQHLMARQQSIPGSTDGNVGPVQALDETLTAESEGQENWEVALDHTRLCGCVCHKPIQLHVSESIRRLAGALAVGGYLARAACNEKLCSRRQSPALQITYRSPSWLLARVFTLTMVSPLGNPQLSLKTMRVLPRRAEIFHMVCTNDLQGVKRMFAAGAASVYDVDDQQWSLVHVRDKF